MIAKGDIPHLIQYKGDVEISVMSNGSVVRNITHNRGTDFLLDTVCRLLSGDDTAMNSIPSFIDLEESFDGNKYSSVLFNRISCGDRYYGIPSLETMADIDDYRNGWRPLTLNFIISPKDLAKTVGAPRGSLKLSLCSKDGSGVIAEIVGGDGALDSLLTSLFDGNEVLIQWKLKFADKEMIDNTENSGG